MKKEYLIKTIDDLQGVVSRFLNDFGDNFFFAFYGDLGAGKTSFIKVLCDEIEVVDNVTSPTFALLNEYYTKKNELICHYDFYRIEEESEIYRIGFYDYLDSAEKIFVEWPEKAESVLPENRVNVTIKTDGEKRIVIVEENK